MNATEYWKLQDDLHRSYLRQKKAIDWVWRRANRGATLPERPAPQEPQQVAAPVPPVPDDLFGDVLDEPQNGEAVNRLIPPAPAVPRVRKSRLASGQFLAAAEDTLKKMVGTFGWKDIGKRMKADHPSITNPERSQIMAFLRKKVESGEVVVREQGAGRRPSVFEKQ
jgi:hypothetical protein